MMPTFPAGQRFSQKPSDAFALAQSEFVLMSSEAMGLPVHLIALLGVALHSFEHGMIRITAGFMAAGFHNASQPFHFFLHIGVHDGGMAERPQIIGGQLQFFNISVI